MVMDTKAGKKKYTEDDIRKTVEEGKRLISQVQETLKKGNEFLSQFNINQETMEKFLADPRTPKAVRDVASKAKAETQAALKKIEDEAKEKFPEEEEKRKRGLKKGRKYL